MKYKINQWTITMPPGVDPGSCGLDELCNLYEKKERIL